MRQLSDIASFTELAACFDAKLNAPARPVHDDLSNLKTEVAREVAELIRYRLDALKFDQLNEIIRGDYKFSPIPTESLTRLRNTISVFEGEHLSSLEALVLKFFLLAEAIPLDKTPELFGERASEIIEKGITSGLFAVDERSRLLTNGLILASHRVGDKVLYFFADPPPTFSKLAPVQRVYAGLDSYFLNAKIQSMAGIDGIAAEAGSGSGIQLITILTKNPTAPLAIGVEIDARARNVSAFNAALNGVSDRFVVVPDAQSLDAQLQGRKIMLAVSNPPFMACPETVKEIGGTRTINLRTLFSRAGWGGPDGMEITKKFVRMLSPHMDDGGELIIYSQFAGDKLYPTRTKALQEEAGLSKSDFMFFPKDRGDAYTFSLSASQWRDYMVRQTMVERPELSSDDQSIIDFGIGAALRKENIEKFHSGFLTLPFGHSRIIHHDLNAEEQKLELSCIGGGTTSLLEMKLKLFGKEELNPPPGIGTTQYVAPDSGIIFAVNLSQTYVELPLAVPKGSEPAMLSVGKYGEQFYYAIKQGPRIVEFGPVEGAHSWPTDRYNQVISSVATLRPHEVLRNLRVGFDGIISAGSINQMYSSKHTKEFWLEPIPALLRFTLRQPEETNGFPNPLQLFGGAGDLNPQKAFRSGSILSLEYLRLRDILVKQRAAGFNAALREAADGDFGAVE